MAHYHQTNDYDLAEMFKVCVLPHTIRRKNSLIFNAQFGVPR
jgi:hypothetical protein